MIRSTYLGRCAQHRALTYFANPCLSKFVFITAGSRGVTAFSLDVQGVWPFVSIVVVFKGLEIRVARYYYYGLLLGLKITCALCYLNIHTYVHHTAVESTNQINIL